MWFCRHILSEIDFGLFFNWLYVDMEFQSILPVSMASSTMHCPLSNSKSHDTDPPLAPPPPPFLPNPDTWLEVIVGTVETDMMSPDTISLLRATSHFLLR